MNLYADKISKKDRSSANAFSQPQKGGKSSLPVVDNRPEVAAQRQRQEMANNSPQVSRATSVVQRIVALGLEKGTKVIIKRTTSKEFHGQTALIEKAGVEKNEYIVRVEESNTILSVRADQLFMEAERFKLRDPGIEADFSTLKGLSQEQIVDHIISFATKTFNLKDQPRVGGSFAAMLHAFSSGTEARTPRDIDVLLSKNDYLRSGGSGQGNPVVTKHSLWGIPIELHLVDIFFKKDKLSETDKLLPKNLLLKKAIVKLIKQNYLFKQVLEKEKEPQHILAAMDQANDDLMRNTDVSEDSRKVWMKAMVDIRALINAGAQLPDESL